MLVDFFLSLFVPLHDQHKNRSLIERLKAYWRRFCENATGKKNRESKRKSNLDWSSEINFKISWRWETGAATVESELFYVFNPVALCAHIALNCWDVVNPVFNSLISDEFQSNLFLFESVLSLVDAGLACKFRLCIKHNALEFVDQLIPRTRKCVVYL